ncbi:MAG: hypothetical protein Q9217_004745 [Psora testacea]
MPERSRLARIMLSNQPATEQKRKQYIADLCSLMSQDFIAFSLPGEELVKGKRPVPGCGTFLTSLRISPQMRKTWPNGSISKSLVRWVSNTKYQKRERPDKDEEDLLPIKRRALQEQPPTLEIQTQDNSLNLKGSDATKVPSHITLSEVSLIDIASDKDKDEVPQLTYSNSTPSLDAGNFQSIDDFATDDSDCQTELPGLFELINEPPIGSNEYGAQSLDEDAIFSQYLRSPSPTCSNVPVISNNVEDCIKLLPQFINLADVYLPLEDHLSIKSVSPDYVKSRESQKLTKPHYLG